MAIAVEAAAAAVAVEEAAAAVVVAARTAAEALARTRGTNRLFCFTARPDSSGGPFVFRTLIAAELPAALRFQPCNFRPHLGAHNSSGPQVLDRVKQFVTGICCFDMGKIAANAT